MAVRSEADAFAALVEPELPRLRRLAVGMVGADAADDALQSALLRAWRGWDGFGGVASVGTWLHRIVVNACLDQRRREAARPTVPLAHAAALADRAADPAAELEVRLDEQARRGALAWAVERATADERRLLALRVAEARSYDQIAAELGVSPRTVGTRLFRLRARLRRLALGRLALALAAALLALSVLARPTAWADLGLFLRQVVLRESAAPAEPTALLPMRRVTLAEARGMVPWRIREPAYLPPGYRLEAVYVGELHAAARGPTVVLDYRRGTAGLQVVELRAGGRLDEDVAPGAAEPRVVDGSRVLVIEGRWVEEGGGRVWRRGDLVRAIVERGDVVLQFQADPRGGFHGVALAELAAATR